MKKSLIDVALQLIAAKQVAKEIAKPITVEVLPEVKIKPTQPILGSIETTTINKITRLIHQTGSGKIDELKIVTDSPNYKIGIWVDDGYIVKDTYTDLQTFAPYYQGIDTHEENGTYYLAIVNLPFKYLFETWVEPTDSPITINHAIWRGEKT